MPPPSPVIYSTFELWKSRIARIARKRLADLQNAEALLCVESDPIPVHVAVFAAMQVEFRRVG